MIDDFIFEWPLNKVISKKLEVIRELKCVVIFEIILCLDVLSLFFSGLPQLFSATIWFNYMAWRHSVWQPFIGSFIQNKYSRSPNKNRKAPMTNKINKHWQRNLFKDKVTIPLNTRPYLHFNKRIFTCRQNKRSEI